MQPVAFLREAWKKWERKRLDKRNNVSAQATFNYRPSPRRSRAFSHQPTQILFEDSTKPFLSSHKWISLKRRRSSTTARDVLYHNPRRDSDTTISPPQYPSRDERDNHVYDFHPRIPGSSRYHASHPRLGPSSKLLPELETSDSQDTVYELPGFKSRRSSLSSYSSPEVASLNVVEKSSTDRDVVFRGQIARITSRTTRLAIGPSAESPTTKTRHHTNRVCDGPSFAQPPPLLARKKVPRPLNLRLARPCSSQSALPLGLPNSPRVGSLRSPSQASFSSQTKKPIGRPLTSVSPPPTSPPNTPLPSPPVDKRWDSNLSCSVYSMDKVPGSVKCQLTASESVTDLPRTSVENKSTEHGSTAQLYRHQNSRQSQPPTAPTVGYYAY